MDSTIYTTNGQIMVRVEADEEELKPLKNQLDNRSHPPMDMEFILSTLHKPETFIAQVQDAEDWENQAGLKCTRASGANNRGEVVTVSVQSMYVDYINARFDDVQWWITDQSLIATAPAVEGQWPTILAIIAPVREDS